MFENSQQHSSSRTDYMFMSLNGLGHVRLTLFRNKNTWSDD